MRFRCVSIASILEAITLLSTMGVLSLDPLDSYPSQGGAIIVCSPMPEIVLLERLSAFCKDQKALRHRFYDKLTARFLRGHNIHISFEPGREGCGKNKP